jgi:hypothetical protein
MSMAFAPGVCCSRKPRDAGERVFARAVSLSFSFERMTSGNAGLCQLVALWLSAIHLMAMFAIT